MIFEGSIGASVPSDMVSDKLSLDHAMDDLGAMFIQAKDTLAKSTSILGAMHKNVLPTSELSSTVDGFASLLGPGTSTMTSFARTLSVPGLESTLKRILGHGIEGDFEAAMSEFPCKPDEKLVSMRLISEPAARLTNIFMTTMGARWQRSPLVRVGLGRSPLHRYRTTETLFLWVVMIPLMTRVSVRFCYTFVWISLVNAFCIFD